MFRKKESKYADKSKTELKEQLQMLNYELATITEKRQLRSFSKEAHEISRELKHRKEMENNSIGRRGR